MGEPIHLGIRETVAFLLQSGSLDNRFGGFNRAQEGSHIHRMLQKEAGDTYQAEVTLSLSVPYGNSDYILEGRADGILEDELITVDEIKTTGTPLELIGEHFNAAHWGQAMCYAYILAVTRGLSRVGLRLTYYNVDTEETKRFHREQTAEELQAFIEDFLAQYHQWIQLRANWSKVRTNSIKSSAFPFLQYRSGQRELSVAVYQTIGQSGRLFCQAPTGIGKTLSTLFPSIKAMGEGLCEKIFYLTAKTITRQAAEEAYTLLRQDGLRIKTVTLTAKDKVCFLEERDCNPEACPYANGYYDRARDAVYSLISGGDTFSRQEIEAGARKFMICPFELALDLSLWCDGIICDYNYLFDPMVYLQRFFGDKGGDHVFLVDEAHNLVERARDMYSAVLTKAGVSSLKKVLGKGKDPLRKAVRALDTQMGGVKKACAEKGFLAQEQPPEPLVSAVMKFSAAASLWLEEHKEKSPLHEQVLLAFFEASFFVKILELYDSRYCCFSSVQNGNASVKLLCMDPSALLDNRMKKGRAAVLFSATLSPLDYYRTVLGGGENAKTYSIPSPFAKENLCLLCADSVSTKYQNRAQSLLPIARLLYQMVNGKSGNYLAYFPSYKYLLDAYTVFRETYPRVETLVQSGSMTEEEREGFLTRFDAGNQEPLLGFCVLGGIFSEGVDLKGNRLIGTAIVGVGLPQIGPELDHLRNHFNTTCSLGYEYIYRFPGMNKVLQAAGRVIRGETDRGVVLLIDDRFPSHSYQSLFPAHWGHWRHARTEAEVACELSAFWKN